MQNNEIKILEQELIELQKSSEELQQEERFLEATRTDNECKYVARKLQIRRQYFRDALAATEGGSQNLLERIDEELERRQMERRLSEVRADEKLEQDLAADDALVPSFISPWDFPPFDYPSDCPRLSQSPER
ncbi:hypothetical protein MMC20_006506 [Loxospora ochrophaea]|nr:hypothetical protein [Loxospora ochrophaea]